MAGRGRGRCTIVEDDEVLSPAGIREEKWRLSTLGEEVKNTEQSIISYVNMTFLISLPFMRIPYVGNISLPLDSRSCHCSIEK
jgi:hypothetical protein